MLLGFNSTATKETNFIFPHENNLLKIPEQLIINKTTHGAFCC